MTTNDLIQDAFGRIREVVHDAVEGLDEEALTFRPGKGANSIAWLVWHLSRIQDDHIAELAQVEQVWLKGGWYERFKLPFDRQATGYGHASGDVAQVKAGADLLLGYYDTVHAQTERFIHHLHPDDYPRIVDGSYDPPVTLAVRLVSVISDDLQHAGQAAYIRGLLSSD